MVIAGLLCRRRGIALVTLASSLAILGLALAETTGWLPPPDQHATLVQWAAYTGLIGLTGGLTYHAYGILQQALLRSRLEVAERARVEAELRRLTRAVQWQRDLAQDLALATAVRPAMQLCLERILEITRMDSGGVYLVERAGADLTLTVWRGLSEAFVQAAAREPVGSPRWQLVHAGKPIYGSYHQLAGQNTSAELSEGLRAFGVIPLLDQGQVIACINITSHSLEQIEPADQAFIEEMALHLGSALARIQAREDLQRSHDQLRLSEEQFRAVFEHSGVGMLMGDLQGRFLRVNPAFCQMLGYTEAELLGRPLQDVLLPEDVPATHAAALQLIDGGLGMAQMEKCYKKRSGELVWVSSTANLVRDAAGRPLHIVAIVQDITARKQAEAALERQRQVSQRMIDKAHTYLVYLDPDFNFVQVNAGYAQTCRREAHELVGQNHFSFYPDPENEHIFRQVRSTRQPVTFHDKPFLFPDQPERGLTYWDWMLSPDLDAAGRLLGLVFSLSETTARRNMEEELRRINQQLNEQLSLVTELKDQLRDQVVRDMLTGLHNRRYLHEALPGEMARARRQGSPIGAIMMDIDHFKNVNDACGQAAGDEVLKALAQLLRGYTRESDILCRYGGEEFLLVLHGADQQVTMRRAEQLRQACAQLLVPYQDRQISVTLSLGVAVYPLHGANMDEVLNRADIALYRSKQSGRNRVTAWS